MRGIEEIGRAADRPYARAPNPNPQTNDRTEGQGGASGSDGFVKLPKAVLDGARDPVEILAVAWLLRWRIDGHETPVPISLGKLARCVRSDRNRIRRALNRSPFVEIRTLKGCATYVRLQLPHTPWVKAPFCLLDAEQPASVKVALLLLYARGRLGSGEMAERLGVTPRRARAVLRRLRDLRLCAAVKLGSRTVYTMADDVKAAWERDELSKLMHKFRQVDARVPPAGEGSTAAQASPEAGSKAADAAVSLEKRDFLELSEDALRASSDPLGQLEVRRGWLEQAIARAREPASEAFLRHVLGVVRANGGNDICPHIYRIWKKWKPTLLEAKKLAALLNARLPDLRRELALRSDPRDRHACAGELVRGLVDEAEYRARLELDGLRVQLNFVDWRLDVLGRERSGLRWGIGRSFSEALAIEVKLEWKIGRRAEVPEALGGDLMAAFELWLKEKHPFTYAIMNPQKRALRFREFLKEVGRGPMMRV